MTGRLNSLHSSIKNLRKSFKKYYRRCIKKSKFKRMLGYVYWVYSKSGRSVSRIVSSFATHRAELCFDLLILGVAQNVCQAQQLVVRDTKARKKFKKLQKMVRKVLFVLEHKVEKQERKLEIIQAKMAHEDRENEILKLKGEIEGCGKEKQKGHQEARQSTSKISK